MEFNLEQNKKDYQKEQDELLYFILNNRYFKNWEKNGFNSNNELSLTPVSNIELFVTSTCNQKCDYCYLVKYNELYPKEINKFDLILSNLKSFLYWIKDNNWYVPSIDLFSGEIWHLPFGEQILQTIYDFCKKYPEHIGSILIPSNGTFLVRAENFFKIQHFIDDFRALGVRFCVSLSIDGKIIEDRMRPLNNHSQKTDDFYENAFTFARHNGYSFHPMVAANSAKDWIENYKWWKTECGKYDMNVREIMMLEVRNDNWDKESITEYNNFMNYLLEDLYQDCGKNSRAMASALFNFPSKDGDKTVDLSKCNYLPYAMARGENYPGCTVPTHLNIRLGDLAIIPCHRTCYEKNVYGFLEKDEFGNIIHIRANNPYLAGRILLGNNITCLPKCDTCLYNSICLKGCFGAQMEVNKDPFLPIPCICDFFKAKLNNLVEQYYKYGIMDYLKSLKDYETSQSPIVTNVIEICERIKKYG